MINAVKKVKQDLEIEQDGNVTFVRELSSGFSLQVTSEQGPECSEGRSHAQNRRISLIGKGRARIPRGEHYGISDSTFLTSSRVGLMWPVL